MLYLSTRCFNTRYTSPVTEYIIITLICLNIGTFKTIKFGTNGKLIVLGVPYT